MVDDRTDARKIYQKTQTRMGKTAKKEQGSTSLCINIMALCSVSRPISSRTQSMILCNYISCIVIDNDSNLFGIILLVTKPSKIRLEEKKRLVTKYQKHS